MFKMLNKAKGQSTLEYAILIIIIIGALLTIQQYVKRGIQGRFKSAADDIGDQFSPGNTNAIKATRVHSKTNDTFGLKVSDSAAGTGQGISRSELIDKETTNTDERVQIVNVDQEYWGKDK